MVHTSWDFLEDNLKLYNDRGQIKGNEGLDLNPDFQRGHVWSEEKQISYVEFCLRGGQSARDILFNHPNWQGSYIGQMVLVDGKQRLEAVRKFLRNELPVFGHTIDEYEDKVIMLRSSNANFIFKVNNLKTRKEVLQWYLDINTGGVVHTEKEIEKVKKLLEKET
jgi:hypothetical protein